MANLGSQKISSNYQKLLQKDDNGMVADGSGSLITLNVSGSEYYTSGSADQYDVLAAITVTGSIIPEGSGSWDLGSEDSPFRHLYITNESLIMIDLKLDKENKNRKVHLKATDIASWQQGEFSKKVDPITKQRLPIAVATTIQTIITEPFKFNRFRNLYPVDLAPNDTVQDTYWANDGDNLYLKPTRFGIVGTNTDDLEIV
jgi:hypothetical protein